MPKKPYTLDQIYLLPYDIAQTYLARTRLFLEPFKTLEEYEHQFCYVKCPYWFIVAVNDKKILSEYFSSIVQPKTLKSGLSSVLDRLTGHPDLEEQLSGCARLGGEEGVKYFLTEVLGVELCNK